MSDSTTSIKRETTDQLNKHQSATRGLRRLDKILIALLMISLLAHVLTFMGFMAGRTMLRSQISQLADGVQQAKSTIVSYDFPIDQQVPININVPIQRSIIVPIQMDVRINQTLRVPVDTGFGVVSLPIPIDATIPISTTVPIEIKQIIPISTTVPIRMTVPLQIDLGSPPFSSYVDRFYRALIELRDQL
ncbi:MAG: hypothetical protein SH847_18730 [Roseiflexaceae bacterium]|nr:hypothetical protein [Roseiflexaceae bacterium]